MAIVLIVEDDASFLELLGESIIPLGHTPWVATTIAEATRAALAQRPDAILLDISLPDASGTAGIDQLRTLRPDVPIIMLTANIDEALARETLKRGAFDYITKPFDVKRLRSVLEVALGASGS